VDNCCSKSEARNERGEVSRKKSIIIIMIGKEQKKGTGTGI